MGVFDVDCVFEALLPRTTCCQSFSPALVFGEFFHALSVTFSVSRVSFECFHLIGDVFTPLFLQKRPSSERVCGAPPQHPSETRFQWVAHFFADPPHPRARHFCKEIFNSILLFDYFIRKWLTARLYAAIYSFQKPSFRPPACVERNW